MAIEIKELIIKLNVENKPKFSKELKAQSFSKEAKQRIVKECVDKVMEKIRNKSDR